MSPDAARAAPPDPAPAEALRPNVFVVGDAKCGTTSLHRLFELAPDVSTTRRKELHFFTAPEVLAAASGPGDGEAAQEIVTTEAAYLAEFAEIARTASAAPRAVVDVSPSYLQNPEAARRIAAFAPDARIIILLREPAAKVFSQYVHLWSEGRETLPFPEAFAQSDTRRAAGFSTMFDYASGGTYAAAVARYVETFGRDRVLILMFEDLINDWPRARADLEGFLGVDLPAGDLPQMNSGGRVKSPFWAAVLGSEGLKRGARALMPLGLRTAISQGLRRNVATEKPVLEPEMRTMLRARYAPDVAALEALLGRPTGWPAT